MRVCVTYNNACPWTTGHHILDAFERLENEWLGKYDVFYSHPDELGSAQEADLYFAVDSGYADYFLPLPPERTLFYSIDGYNRSYRDAWYLQIAGHCKWVFEVTRAGQDWFMDHEINVRYSPLGFNEEMYYYEDSPQEHQICFVGGRKDQGWRKQILDIVGDNFDLHSPAVHGDDLRKVINSSKCFLDIPPFEGDHQGQRFYEGLGCCANIVTLGRSSVRAFEDPNLFYYHLDNLEESLLDAIPKAMVQPREIYTSGHTYTNRIKDIMGIVEKEYEA